MSETYDYCLYERVYKYKLIKLIDEFRPVVIAFTLLILLILTIPIFGLKSNNLVGKTLEVQHMKILGLIIPLVVFVVLVLFINELISLATRKYSSIEKLNCKLVLAEWELQNTINGVTNTYKYSDIKELRTLFCTDMQGLKHPETVGTNIVEIIGSGWKFPCLKMSYREGEGVKFEFFDESLELFILPMHLEEPLTIIVEKTGKQISFYMR